MGRVPRPRPRLSGGARSPACRCRAVTPGSPTRNLYQPARVCLEQRLGALVAARSGSCSKNSRNADRMAAPRAPVRRRERRSRDQRVAHRRDGAGAHKRHVGKRDEVAFGPCPPRARRRRGSRPCLRPPARTPPPDSPLLESGNEIAGSRLHHGDTSWTAACRWRAACTAIGTPCGRRWASLSEPKRVADPAASRSPTMLNSAS